MKKSWWKGYRLVALLIFTLIFSACSDFNIPSDEKENATSDATEEMIETLSQTQEGKLIVAATPEMNRHGLMDALLPDLEKRAGVELALKEVTPETFVELAKNRAADIFFTEDYTLADTLLKEHVIESSSPFYENDLIIAGSEEIGFDFDMIKESMATSGAKLLVSDAPYIVKMAEKLNMGAQNPISIEKTELNTKEILPHAQKGTFVMTDRASFLKDGASTVLVLDDARFMNFGLAMVLPSDGKDQDRMKLRDKVLYLILEKETEDVLRSLGDGVYRVIP